MCWDWHSEARVLGVSILFLGHLEELRLAAEESRTLKDRVRKVNILQKNLHNYGFWLIKGAMHWRRLSYLVC